MERLKGETHGAWGSQGLDGLETMMAATVWAASLYARHGAF